MGTGKEKMVIGYVLGIAVTAFQFTLSFLLDMGLIGVILTAIVLLGTLLAGYVFGIEQREEKVNYKSYMKGYQEGKSEQTVIFKSEEGDMTFKLPSIDGRLINLRKERKKGDERRKH